MSRYAAETQLNVPPFWPPTKVDVPNSAPNPVAVPSQFTWMITLPAGPGLRVEVIDFKEYSLSSSPMPYAYPPLR
jgi:hypothetical protein